MVVVVVVVAAAAASAVIVVAAAVVVVEVVVVEVVVVVVIAVVKVIVVIAAHFQQHISVYGSNAMQQMVHNTLTQSAQTATCTTNMGKHLLILVVLKRLPKQNIFSYCPPLKPWLLGNITKTCKMMTL